MINVARARNIEGWMSDNELRFLAEHASKYKTILEVGSYKGRSTRAMADNSSGTIYAIDPWNGNYGKDYDDPHDIAFRSYKTNGHLIYKEFQKNLTDHIKTGKVVPIKDEFNKFYTPSPGMIFIDACHEYNHVKDDIHHSLLMTPQFLCGHDYSGNWPGVMAAVDEIFGPGLEKVDSIWWINL
jgi:hypothetical protein